MYTARVYVNNRFIESYQVNAMDVDRTAAVRGNSLVVDFVNVDGDRVVIIYR